MLGQSDRCLATTLRRFRSKNSKKTQILTPISRMMAPGAISTRPRGGGEPRRRSQSNRSPRGEVHLLMKCLHGSAGASRSRGDADKVQLAWLWSRSSIAVAT